MTSYFFIKGAWRDVVGGHVGYRICSLSGNEAQDIAQTDLDVHADFIVNALNAYTPQPAE